MYCINCKKPLPGTALVTTNFGISCSQQCADQFPERYIEFADKTVPVQLRTIHRHEAEVIIKEPGVLEGQKVWVLASEVSPRLE